MPLLLLASVLAAGLQSPPARFSLIVTYNGGVAVNRPPLRYADDDGAKYREVFDSLDEPGGTLLLTEFDDDSAKLFPELAKTTPAPTLGNVALAADELAKQVAKAKAAGRATELTFVYAGHGDVDHGKGFLVLKDGTVDGEALEKVVKTVGADRSDVILDSCNSFFVLTPRGGGHRFATPSDVADQLKQKLPNVGLFLSTNAEAEVYEWSELQSGVFSHAVRSGLLGAADANGDGVVTYEELAAFVDRSTADIKNPLFRPKIFARGPGGNNQAALADLRSSPLAALTIDDPSAVRLSIRDRDGVRWLDLHKEAGSKVVLRLPARVAEGGSVESGDNAFALPTPFHDSALAMLEATPPTATKRGTTEILETLFAEPFGPVAYATYEKDKTADPEPVFGVSEKERQRMDSLLGEIAQQGRSVRLTNGGSGTIVGGATVVSGVILLALPGLTSAPGVNQGFSLSQELGIGLAVGGVVAGGVGIWRLTSDRSEQELILQRFTEKLKQTSAEDAYRGVDLELEALDLKLHQERRWSIMSGGIGILCGALLIAIGALQPAGGVQIPFEIEGSIVIGGAAATTLPLLFQEDPTSRLIRLWREDRSGLELSGVSVAPIDQGNIHGATFGLAGRF